MALGIPVAVPVSSPLINGQRYSYASISISVDGVELFGQDVLSVDYKHMLKPEKIFGTSPVQIGRTKGRYEADGSMEVTKEAYIALVTKLSEDPNFGYMEKPFVVNVHYEEPNQIPQDDTLIGCRLTEDEDSHKSGPEGLSVKATIDIHMILRNGLPPVAM